VPDGHVDEERFELIRSALCESAALQEPYKQIAVPAAARQRVMGVLANDAVFKPFAYYGR